MIYSNYLKSSHWIETRLDIIQTRKSCERCGSKRRLQVHHLSYKNLGKEEPEDLELLCSACHANEHGKLKKNKVKTKPKKSNHPKKMTKKQKRIARIRGEMKRSRKFQNNYNKHEEKYGQRL